ncbi:MAG TPA: MmgE/PrpD family protein [Gemmatimonadota bacterium]|nr:MmgE/PrpD family protein [Gemmatimonadota bacterium]
MTHVQELARFVTGAELDDLSDGALEQLKIRVLDSLGCAIGAVEGEPVRAVRAGIEEAGETGSCTLIGGGLGAPDRAAFYNGALVRYLDFNDSYLAPGETCHPSDNLGAVLACAEYAGGSGRDFLAALAAAYQVQCRLSDVAPVRDRGFDHATQGAFSTAAGAARALGLDAERTANALAISGTANVALRVTRTGTLSNWKGLAMPDTGRNGVHAALLARRGITGPPEVFEGNKGWRWSVSGEWELDWSAEDLERVTRTDLKKYNAEIHSQSSVEGALELAREHDLEAADIERVDLEVFDVAFDIIGGGEEGGKKEGIRTKEQADHSLPYIVAVALLDGGVYPEQYRPERIRADDVQDLLRRVEVHRSEEYSRRFPEEHACRVTITTRGGDEYETEKTAYEGFHSMPMSWETVERKFARLSGPYAGDALRDRIVETVRGLEDADLADLTGALSRVEIPEPEG